MTAAETAPRPITATGFGVRNLKKQKHSVLGLQNENTVSPGVPWAE